MTVHPLAPPTAVHASYLCAANAWKWRLAARARSRVFSRAVQGNCQNVWRRCRESRQPRQRHRSSSPCSFCAASCCRTDQSRRRESASISAPMLAFPAPTSLVGHPNQHFSDSSRVTSGFQSSSSMRFAFPGAGNASQVSFSFVWPTPRFDQSHTPSGKMLLSLASSASVKVTL